MLVFSRWGYNHYKLFANAPGLHHRVKTKTELWWGLKWGGGDDMTLREKKNTTTDDKNTQNKSYTLTRFS